MVVEGVGDAGAEGGGGGIEEGARGEEGGGGGGRGLSESREALDEADAAVSWGLGAADREVLWGEVEGERRLTPYLGRQYSSVQCLGPASMMGVASRLEHPLASVSPEDLSAGLETAHGGGARQRTCRIRNACLTTQAPDIHLHLDPALDDLDVEFLKADAADGLGSRFVQVCGWVEGDWGGVGGALLSSTNTHTDRL